MNKLKLALFMVALAILQLVQAQDQQGFISLDCGLPPNESPYTEATTGLIFTSDANFIQSGKRGRIGNPWDFTHKQYNALRYFPDGIRNCYNLNVKQGLKYLIRAGFAYGNYDGLKIYPGFDIYIGPNLWTSVSFYDEFFNSDIKDFEIIHMAKSNSLQICLVKTGTATPMISTLELRPLRNDSYSTQSGSLALIGRQFRDYSPSAAVRYPEDVYDRQWKTYYWFSGSKEINTTLSVNTSNPFALPEVIARAAITPKDANDSLAVHGRPDNPGDNIVFYLHFAEIQDIGANETREFDIVWDGNITTPAYRPKMLQIDTIFNSSPKKCDDGSCYYELVRTPRSTLPPLLSGSEIYEVKEFPYSETYAADVAAIKNIQSAYGLNINSWQGDPCLPEHLKWEDIKCSYNTNKSTPPRIISLELPSRGLSGIISPALQNLTELRRLDLSNNSLSGGVPEFLATMKSLSIINLSYNKLKGRVPQALGEKKGLQLLIQGNPKLCMDDSCKTETKKILVPIIASVAALVLIIALLVVLFVFRKGKKLKGRSQQPTKASILTKKRRFTYSELEAITNNFESIIGEGGFGIIYRGSLGDAQQLAVKLLSQSSTQGYNQFKAEVELLLRVHHVNLVSFVGYCFEKGHLALVYEYTTHGDLKQHLSGEHSGPALSWASRLNIAADIAQALDYLHTGCRPAMVHRDVKSTNIVIDEQFHAKLVDFGLSRSFAVGVETQIATIVAGTPGYLDPEYNQTSWLTEKSDVYSFGIVLLELITNRPVIEPSRENPHIAEWVRLMLTREGIEHIVDPSLIGDYEARSMWKVVELAISCVNPSSAGRPNMSHVVNELKECILLVSENSKEIGTTEVDSNSSFEQIMGFTGEISR